MRSDSTERMPFVSAALVSVVGRAAVDTAATVHKLRQT